MKTKLSINSVQKFLVPSFIETTLQFHSCLVMPRSGGLGAHTPPGSLGFLAWVQGQGAQLEVKLAMAISMTPKDGKFLWVHKYSKHVDDVYKQRNKSMRYMYPYCT